MEEQSQLSVPVLVSVVFAVCVVLTILCKSNSGTSDAKTPTGLNHGTISLVIPIHQPTHPTYIQLIEDLFKTATHPLRVHLIMGVPHGVKAKLTHVLYEKFNALGLPVTVSNVHILETDHVTHAADDCIRAHLSKMCSNIVLHLRQPASIGAVENGWDVFLESQVHLHPGTILTSPFPSSPSFTALQRDFHEDTNLPVSAVYSAGKAMEMPAAVFSSVYAVGGVSAFVPFDAHLCDSLASADVVYSARLWVHGTNLVHPESCPITYTALPKPETEPYDDTFANNRQLCQMGVIVLPNTTREAKDLPGPPLTKEQREAWGHHVGTDFNKHTVTVRGIIGATQGCGTLVVFNKGQRL